MINILKLKGLFIFLGAIFLVFGCTHHLDPIDPQGDLKRIGRPYVTQENEQLDARLSYFDLEPQAHKQFVWQAFILPKTNGISFSESDLLVGYSLSPDNFISPPQSGSCHLLQTRESTTNSKKLKAFYFVSQNPNPSEESESLFMIFDPITSKPQAIARLNTKGEAICFLEDKKYTASTRFGQNRDEIIVSNQEKKIALPWRKKGSLYIFPAPINAVLNGDLIRIGRKENQEHLKFETMSENNLRDASGFLIPTQLEDDLYKESNFQSTAMGVQEYLKTSFLVGTTPYNINLDIGTYIVTVLRKNRIVCTQEIDLKPNIKQTISCKDENNQDEEKLFFETTAFPYTIDASLYPLSIAQNATFLNWLLPTNGTLASLLSTETKNSNEEKLFSFLFGNKNGEFFQTPFSFKMAAHKLNSQIPILDTEIDTVVKGLVPYTFFTRIVPTQKIDEHFLTASYVQTTNGALIQVYDPDVLQKNVFQNTKEKIFRLHLFVPAWNSSNVVEMLIDDKIESRLVFNRGDIAEPFTTTFDFKTFKSLPFSVKFTAQGDSFLPDYLTGMPSLLPYCTTRTYFFKQDTSK